MCPGRLRGCKRGVYGLDSWDPLRKPGEEGFKSSDRDRVAEVRPQEQKSQREENMASRKSGDEDIKKGRPMIVKYKYVANKNSPLGQELDVQMGDMLRFIEYHPENKWWIMAENKEGEVGYVPADYTQFQEESPRGLPWLKNHEPEPEPSGNNVFGSPAKGGYKPYKPTYVHKDLPQSGTSQTPEYYCEVCEKQLNGPKPYQAHLASKGHREEVEFRNGES